MLFQDYQNKNLQERGKQLFLQLLCLEKTYEKVLRKQRLKHVHTIHMFAYVL